MRFYADCGKLGHRAVEELFVLLRSDGGVVGYVMYPRSLSTVGTQFKFGEKQSCVYSSRS